MYVAAVGAGYIRVNSSQDISIGDLLQSNGDGTAKIQSDDIMLSSTIAKVVSTNKIETYEGDRTAAGLTAYANKKGAKNWYKYILHILHIIYI